MNVLPPGVERACVAFAAFAFLLTPAAAYALGARAEAFENRPLVPFPAPREGWRFFADVDRWATDHLPLRRAAVRFERLLDEEVFDEPLPAAAVAGAPGAGNVPTVIEGEEGFLFLGEDVARRCDPPLSADDVVERLGELARAAESSGRRFVVVVPPDKSTVYSELLPASFPGAECAARHQAEAWASLNQLPEVIDLREPMRAAAAAARAEGGEPIYGRQDTHWDGPGAAVMIDALARRLDPDVAATFQPRLLVTGERTADLAYLLAREESWTTRLIDLVDPAVTHDFTAVPDLAEAAFAGRSSGPAGTLITSPALVVVDSFAVAAGPGLPNIFATVTMAHHNSLLDDPAPLLDAAASSDLVIVAVVERDLITGDTPLLQQDHVDALTRVMLDTPRGR